MLASLRLGVRTICRFVAIRGIAVCLEKWLISSDTGRSVYATHGKVALGLCPSHTQVDIFFSCKRKDVGTHGIEAVQSLSGFGYTKPRTPALRGSLHVLPAR